MKTYLNKLLTTVTLAGAALLTGCTTMPDMQQTFTRGDEVLYGRVTNLWMGKDMLEARETLCGTKYKRAREYYYSSNIDVWLKQTDFCSESNLNSIQQVQVSIGVVNANGVTYTSGGFAPKSFDLEKGDIVAIQVFPGPDGRMRQPGQILKIAAKSKDATKANGCYWDAGTGVWSGFNQGGAVCEGWHWKNHPFSNPKLLKQ